MTESEQGSTNVYADLGRPDAEEMLIKAQLASQISEIIKRRRLTQTAASDIIGLPQPKLSGLLRGQFRGISEANMLACLTRLGRDVTIVVGPARRRPGASWFIGLDFEGDAIKQFAGLWRRAGRRPARSCR